MIQRKQTLFLFFAAVALALDFFFPLAKFIGENDSVILYIYKTETLLPEPKMPFTFNFILPLLIIAGLSIFMSFGAIFMFKNRPGQMKVVKLVILLVAIEVGLFFLYYVDKLEEYTKAVAEYDIAGVSAPLAAIVLLVLAYRGIVQDERLVKSADRLR